MSNYPAFSDDAVNNAIDAVNQHYSSLRAQKPTSISSDDGHVLMLAECIKVSIKNGKACLSLPLGIGDVCIPVPLPYEGEVGQACLHMCTTWGIPTGVKVTISVGGVQIVSKSFGKC